MICIEQFEQNPRFGTEISESPGWFADVRNDAPLAPNPIHALIDHLERHYVGTGQAPVRFPNAIWTLFGRNGAPRTSCSAESFNSLINRRCKVSGGRAKLSKLLNVLRDEEDRMRVGLPAVTLSPTFRLSVNPSTSVRKHADKVDLVVANPNGLVGLAFLDWASSTVGRFKKS